MKRGRPIDARPKPKQATPLVFEKPVTCPECGVFGGHRYACTLTAHGRAAALDGRP